MRNPEFLTITQTAQDVPYHSLNPSSHCSYIQATSFVKLSNGTLKRRKLKKSYQDIYLEKQNYWNTIADPTSTFDCDNYHNTYEEFNTIDSQGGKPRNNTKYNTTKNIRTIMVIDQKGKEEATATKLGFIINEGTNKASGRMTEDRNAEKGSQSSYSASKIKSSCNGKNMSWKIGKSAGYQKNSNGEGNMNCNKNWHQLFVDVNPNKREISERKQVSKLCNNNNNDTKNNITNSIDLTHLPQNTKTKSSSSFFHQTRTQITNLSQKSQINTPTNQHPIHTNCESFKTPSSPLAKTEQTNDNEIYLKYSQYKEKSITQWIKIRNSIDDLINIELSKQTISHSPEKKIMYLSQSAKTLNLNTKPLSIETDKFNKDIKRNKKTRNSECLSMTQSIKVGSLFSKMKKPKWTFDLNSKRQAYFINENGEIEMISLIQSKKSKGDGIGDNCDEGPNGSGEEKKKKNNTEKRENKGDDESKIDEGSESNVSENDNDEKEKAQKGKTKIYGIEVNNKKREWSDNCILEGNSEEQRRGVEDFIRAEEGKWGSIEGLVIHNEIKFGDTEGREGDQYEQRVNINGIEESKDRTWGDIEKVLSNKSGKGDHSGDTIPNKEKHWNHIEYNYNIKEEQLNDIESIDKKIAINLRGGKKQMKLEEIRSEINSNNSNSKNNSNGFENSLKTKHNIITNSNLQHEEDIKNPIHTKLQTSNNWYLANNNPNTNNSTSLNHIINNPDNVIKSRNTTSKKDYPRNNNSINIINPNKYSTEETNVHFGKAETLQTVKHRLININNENSSLQNKANTTKNIQNIEQSSSVEKYLKNLKNQQKQTPNALNIALPQTLRLNENSTFLLTDKPPLTDRPCKKQASTIDSSSFRKSEYFHAQTNCSSSHKDKKYNPRLLLLSAEEKNKVNFSTLQNQKQSSSSAKPSNTQNWDTNTVQSLHNETYLNSNDILSNPKKNRNSQHNWISSYINLSCKPDMKEPEVQHPFKRHNPWLGEINLFEGDILAGKTLSEIYLEKMKQSGLVLKSKKHIDCDSSDDAMDSFYHMNKKGPNKFKKTITEKEEKYLISKQKIKINKTNYSSTLKKDFSNDVGRKSKGKINLNF